MCLYALVSPTSGGMDTVFHVPVLSGLTIGVMIHPNFCQGFPPLRYVVWGGSSLVGELSTSLCSGTQPVSYNQTF